MVKADERGETKGRGDGTYCGIEGPRQRKADPNFCIASQNTEHRISSKSAV
jgi:hypothetical protein